jgi:ankyrin repeat protein
MIRGFDCVNPDFCIHVLGNVNSLFAALHRISIGLQGFGCVAFEIGLFCVEEDRALLDLHESAWHEAAYRNDVDILAQLIEQGQDIEEKVYDDVDTVVQVTALMIAAERGNVEAVRFLVQAGADLENQNEYGGTALMCAAYRALIEMVTLLIDLGANVNVSTSATALNCAVQSEDVETVKVLLDRGAQVDLKDESGMNALNWAENIDHEGIRELLLRAV